MFSITVAENDANLFLLSGVYDNHCNEVTSSSSSIYAPRDSTLKIDSSYNNYDEYYGYSISKSWFRTKGALQGWRRSLGDSSTNLPSAGCVQVSSRRGGSTLRTWNLTESDSAEYELKVANFGCTNTHCTDTHFLDDMFRHLVFFGCVVTHPFVSVH